MEAVYSRERAKSLFQPVQPVYLLYGEEEFLKDEAIEALKRAVIDDSFEEFDYQVLEAEAVRPEEILASSELVPLGSERRMVVIRGAEIYRRRDKQTEAEQLAAGIARMSAACCLVFRVAALEEERSRGKTILTSKLDNAIRARGCVVQCRAMSEEDVTGWLVSQARNAGKMLNPDAAERLYQAAHGDRVALVQELEKAICFVGEQPRITLEAVEAVCSYDPEDVMFRLVESICQRNAERSLTLLRELLRYDPKPQSVAGRLLALLARQFRFLWQAMELQRRRIDPMALKNLPPEVASELPSEASIASMHWKGRELFGQARHWNRASLSQAFEWLLMCDLANKGGEEGTSDIVANVELLIVRLCSLRA